MSDDSNLADLLKIYYARLFPFNDYYRWLSYGSVDIFARREFSFTLRDDIYIRFQSFKTRKELEQEIKRLIPFKIDIGAIYNLSPKHQKYDPKFEPVQRELVFDIDMTDYDAVRTCCKEANVCAKCWKFMVIACRVLDTALREDFGYRHILWIFSGRRGIHCWVCDLEARTLSPRSRGAVAEYLQIISGGEFMRKKVNLPGDKIHHSIKRALDIIEPMFIPMCIEEQNILGTEDEIKKFLPLIQDEEDREDIGSLFMKHSTSLTRWNAFVKHIKSLQISGKKKSIQYRHLIEEIMLQYAYPRLDIHVSKGMNHLLKSPFCVHPKTGKVCIPFTANTVDKIDLEKLPTIMTLINEINAFDAKDKAEQENLSLNTKNIKDYKKTSLNKSLHVFNQFLRGLEESQKGQNIKKSDQKMEF